jgi:hypothetical protein
VEVQLGVNFLKVMDLDLKTSVMTMPVWLRLQWTDLRLKFNTSLWGVESLQFVATLHDLENTRIWVPEIELYNCEDSIDDTLAKKQAILSPDGGVFWSRNGQLKILCKFQGLEQFPLDSLRCVLEFGAWSSDSRSMNIILRKADGGVVFPNKADSSTSATAGSSFQDHTISDIQVRRIEKHYDCCPGFWPEILYTVKLRRGRSFYLMKLIVPQVAMACLSVITYFMNPDIGERLGFGITLVLAVIATDIVATDFMPVCEEVLVMNYVSWLCLGFCVLSLFESGVVLTVFHLEGGLWHQVVCGRYFGPIGSVAGRAAKSAKRFVQSKVVTSSTGRSPATVEAFSAAVIPDSGDSGESGFAPAGIAPAKVVVAPQPQVETHTLSNVSIPSQRLPETCRSQPTNTDCRLRHQLYREAFYILDHDFSGKLETAEVDYFGRFMCGDQWSEELLDTFMKNADTNQSGGLSLDEFSAFCESAILDTHESQEYGYVSEMVKGFISMVSTRREMAKRKWQARAIKIDLFFRFFVPFCMFVVFCWMYPTYKDMATLN